MKKTVAVMLSCLMLVGMLIGCTPTAPVAPAESTAPEATAAPAQTAAPVATDAPPAALTGKLVIWSFTNEMKTFAVAFKEKNPGVEIEFTMVPMTNGEFQTKVQAAITGGEVPDVIALESSFVKSYVESDFLMDLTDLLPLAQELQTYPVTLEVGTHEGITKAYSYQATPGALFYRRSLAKEYFGTDDPVKMQELLSDMTKYEAAAKVIKEKSNGNTFTVGSPMDFAKIYYPNRQQPWDVDGKFVIDPSIDQLFEVAKSFRQNGYEAQAVQWQEGWFAGMNDSLVDAKGNPKQVFSYFLPTWGLPYVLMPNSKPRETDGVTTGKDTSGDWATIPGPMPYQWGGTWVGAMKDAENVELAKEFVKFVALNEETLTNWALGTYTNEYLKKIDPTVGDELAQGAGDFVSSKKVVDAIISKFDNSDNSKFLAGQNSYKGFADAAPSVSAKLMQGTDDAVDRALVDVLTAYAAGKTTKEEAIQAFKDAVKNAIPDLIVE